MRANQFHQLGLSLRKSVDPLLPEEMRLPPEQPTAPQQDRMPQRGAAPQSQPPQSPTGGQGNPFALNDFQYDQEAADQVIQFYLNKGYDPEFAVGMAANGVVESGLNPNAYNPEENAVGIFQHRESRLTGDEGLRTFAETRGMSLDDLNTHLEFSLYEYANAEQAAYKAIMTGDYESAADYARAIDKYYERSSGAHREKRAKIAQQMYSQYFGEDGRMADGRTPLSFGDEPGIGGIETQTRGQAAFDPRVFGGEGLSMGTPESAFDPDMMTGEPSLGTAEFAIQPSQATTAQPNVSQGATTAFVPPSNPNTSQAPAGGQLGTSSQAAGTGELGGMREIFMRREGESDESFGDRRRNIFLNAAEGFQMLSRGEKADFVTPTQQRLNQAQRRVDNSYRDIEQVRQQGNADRNYGLARQQEARLQRAQAFEEYKYEQATIKDEMAGLLKAGQEEKTMDFFRNSEEHKDLVPLIEGGQVDAAMDIYTAREEAKVPQQGSDYTVGPTTAGAAAQYATELGREDLATQVQDTTNPRTQFEALKKIQALTASDDQGFTVDPAKFDQYKATKPGNLTPSQSERYDHLARMAASTTSDTVEGRLVDAMQEIATSPSPVSGMIEAVVAEAGEEYSRTVSVGNDLREAGINTMELAANPDFNPNQLKGSLVAPFARYLRGIPGGDQLAEKFAGVTDADVFANELLDAIGSGQLGNLAQGVTGQLSNLEGQRLLRQIGDGTNERAEIMALGQLLAIGVEKDIAGLDAKLKYLNDPANRANFSVAEMEKQTRAARRAEPVFPQAQGVDALLDLQDQAFEKYGTDDFYSLPPEVRGQVVQYVDNKGGIQYRPLFSYMFDEYKGEFNE